MLGLRLSPGLRKQKQQVVLFRAGMFLLGQVLAVAGTFPVAFHVKKYLRSPASSAYSVITSCLLMFLAKFWHHFSVTVLEELLPSPWGAALLM